jgi:hypothetical protein
MVYQDKIDDYLRGTLNEADKAAFEAEMEGNTELTREVRFQEMVVDGLRSARRAELKAMLNNVPVSGGSTGFFNWKMATAFGVILLGLFAVWYINIPEETSTEIEERVVESTPSEPNQEVTQPDVITEVTEEITETPRASTPVVAPKSTRESKRTSSPKTTEKPVTEKSPGIISGFEKEDEPNEPSEMYSESAIEMGKASYSSLEVEVDNSDGKYKFHYQFKAGKLLLMGSFDKGLYEILEFNSEGKKTVFLYYRDKFYHLKETQTKIMALEELQDKVLELKLREFTGK